MDSSPTEVIVFYHYTNILRTYLPHSVSAVSSSLLRLSATGQLFGISTCHLNYTQIRIAVLVRYYASHTYKCLLTFRHWLYNEWFIPDVKRTVHRVIIIAHCPSFVRRLFIYKL